MENEFVVKTSDLVKPIQHNHEKKEDYLNLLFRRMDKAFELLFKPSKPEGDSSQSVLDPDMCAIPRKLPYSFIAEYDEIKDNPALKAILIVATVLEKFKVFSYYSEDCFYLLQQIYRLVKDFHQLKDFPILHHLHKIKNADSDSVLTTALHALHSCFFAATFRGHDRVVLNQCAYKSEIRKQCNLVLEARRDLVTQMRVYILRYEERREREEKVQEEKVVLEENAASEAKGSPKKKTVLEVENDLHLQGPEQCAAVILRGQCSTHVGDAIYHHLKQNLLEYGFKYAKIEVAEGEEFLPDINKLRAPLLSVLEENETFIVNQFDLLRKSIFIYIDNLLSTQDLRSIFGSKLRHLKKLRLLVRSPNEGVNSTLKEYGFKEPIVIKEVNVIINSGSKEKDHDKEKEHGEEKDHGQEKDHDKVNKEKEHGEEKDHGQEKDHDKVNKEKDDMDKFALEHAFQNLPLTAQDAFLDICYFFVEWDWNEVSVIVGEDELQVLEANMWVKKNPSNRITVTNMLVDFGKLRDGGCSRKTSVDKLKDELGKVKGLWLSTKDQTAVHITATTLEHMSGSLRVLFLDGVTVEQVRDAELFPKLRFVHVDGCALPFHLKQLCDLNYLRCGDEYILSKQPESSNAAGTLTETSQDGNQTQVDNQQGLKYSIEEELKDFTMRGRKSKLDIKILKLKPFLVPSILRSHLPGALKNLRELSISIWNEIEFPQSLCQMYFLQKLDLHDSNYLQDLTDSFTNLRCLRKLDLRYCCSLIQLPETFGELQCLEELVLTYCVALKQLPASFIWLSCLKKVTFSHCHALQKLPPLFQQLASLQEVDISFCKKLESLPTNFHQLSSLKVLNMEGCSKLIKLPDTFPESLLSSECVALKFCGCSSLTEVPEAFCEKNQIEDLSLADCTKLEKLPAEIGQLKRLRKLNLSKCENLVELPKTFSALSCLEVLNLMCCTRLTALCSEFNRLKALKYLNLSNCSNLEGKWMWTVIKLRSLLLVDIRESKNLNSQWSKLETVHLKICCNVIVLKDQKQPSDKSKVKEDVRTVGKKAKYCLHTVFDKSSENQVQAIFDQAASKLFKKQIALSSPDGRPLSLSKIASVLFTEQIPLSNSEIEKNANLAFVFHHNISRWDQEMLENNADRLILKLSSRGIKEIIYVGTSFTAIPAKLAEKVSAYTPEDSPALSLFDKLLLKHAGEDFWAFNTYIVETVVEERDGHAHLNRWKSISGELFGRSSNDEINNNLIKKIEAVENPYPGNLNDKFLEILCLNKVPEEKEVLKNSGTFGELQGENVFLLISTLEITQRQISFFKEIYNEIEHEKKKNRSDFFNFRWVWVPVVDGGTDNNHQSPKLRLPLNMMPCEVIPNPFSKDFLREKIGFNQAPILVTLLDGFPKFLPNMIPIRETFGLKALCFLIDSFYSKFDHKMNENVKCNVLLQKLPRIFKSSTTKMIWLFGGDHAMVLEFKKKLLSISKVAKDIEIVYVGNSKEEEDDLYVKHTDFPSWPNCMEVKEFWNDIHYLVYLRACYWFCDKLLLALLSLDCLAARNGTVWMMVINEDNAEVFSGRGKELVDLLCTNISNSLDSRILLEKGMVEVFSEKPKIKLVRKAENKQVQKAENIQIPPDLQFLDMDLDEEMEVEYTRELSISVIGEKVEDSEEGSIKFKDAPWLTSHPYSHLVQQIPDCPYCSICYSTRRAYQCNKCRCFTICQRCFDDRIKPDMERLENQATTSG